MSNPTVRRRKLSSWHGLLTAGAVIADEHCLISVHSFGPNEQVRRLFYKDIQAIVVSRARRFNVSRIVLLGGFVLIIGAMIAGRFSEEFSRAVWAALVLGGLTWLFVSLFRSCRCFVYTAVGKEELISVRTTWVAHKLQRELAPRIQAVQGVNQDTDESAAPAEQTVILGRAIVRDQAGTTGSPEPAETRGDRFPVLLILTALLFVDAVLTGWDLQRAQPMPAWIGSVLALVEGAAAAWVMIQHRGGAAGLRRFGATVIIFLGLAFYGQVMVASFSAAQAKRPLRADEIRTAPMGRTYREAYIGISIILGFAGAFLLTGSPGPRRRNALAE